MEDDHYAEWAPLYPPCAHNPLMKVEEAALLALLPPVAGLTVLDAGCGTGRYAQLVTSRGARRVVGVDLSSAMLLRCAPRGARRIRGDLHALPVATASCDLVISGLMLPDIADLECVVGEWRRVLKPDGVVVCSTLHPIGAEMGWTRTFETSHGTRSLPAHWHTLADHHHAFAAAGLSIDAMVEPCLSPRVPVALVVRARRGR